MRVVLFLIVFVNLIYANNYSKAKILKSQESINFKNIKENRAFKSIEFPLVLKRDSDDYWIKLDIDKTALIKDNKLLKISSMFGINDIQIEPSLDKYLIDQNTLEIDSSIPNTLYFKIINIQDNINVSIDILDKRTYFKNKIFKSKLYGIAQGVTFTAFIYYLLFFIFNKRRSFLYYSLTQLFTAGILLLSQQSNYLPYDFISTGFVVFSILFTQEFLQSKKHLPFIHKIFNFMIILFILDMFFFISKYFPISFFLLLYPISGAMTYYKTKQKEVLIYVIAWGLVVLAISLITIEVFLLRILPFDINFVDFLHVILPLESIILAFALSYSMKVNEQEKIEKEKLLVHQNKLASLGEMINNIAHQWRQPLTHLNYVFMNLNKAYEYNKLDQSYLAKKTQEAKDQLKYMSNTIDIFKDFYTPKTEQSQIDVKEELNNTLQIISATLEKEKIDIQIQGGSFSTFGFKGELSQVFLNLITNAKDALLHRDIPNPKIKISFTNNIIKVSDNAGGIDEQTAKNIFKPYFTTKDEGNGIGLYMSKLIVEDHFKGRLIYEKIDELSVFIVDLSITK